MTHSDYIRTLLKRQNYRVFFASTNGRIALRCIPWRNGYKVIYKTFDWIDERTYATSKDCETAVYRWALKHKYCVWK